MFSRLGSRPSGAIVTNTVTRKIGSGHKRWASDADAHLTARREAQTPRSWRVPAAFSPCRYWPRSRRTVDRRPRRSRASRSPALGGSSPTRDRKSTRLNSSHLVISYAVFFLEKKKHNDKSVHGGLHPTNHA